MIKDTSDDYTRHTLLSNGQPAPSKGRNFLKAAGALLAVGVVALIGLAQLPRTQLQEDTQPLAL